MRGVLWLRVEFRLFCRDSGLEPWAAYGLLRSLWEVCTAFAPELPFPEIDDDELLRLIGYRGNAAFIADRLIRSRFFVRRISGFLEPTQLLSRAWRDALTKRDHRHRRRARERASPAIGIPDNQWREIVEAFGRRCAYCLEPLAGDETQDHLTPLSRRGTHTADNVVPSCRGCNSRKGTKTQLEFLCGLPRLGAA